MPKRLPKKNVRRDDGISNSTEALTVAWSMTVMMGLLCDVGSAIARLLFHYQPDAQLIGVLAGFLLFAAAVLGLFSMLMLPMVLKLRKQRPPQGFLVLAVIVAVAPMLAMAVEALR